MNDLFGLTSLSPCRQSSNGSTTHSTRAQRNRLYRSKMKAQWLPQGAREFHRTNPCALCLPRAFNLQFEKPDETPESAEPVENAKITFNGFGNRAHGLKLNGHHIGPEDLSYQPGTSGCTFGSAVRVDGCPDPTPVVGHFDFTPSYTSALGSLEVGEHDYPVTLEPAWVTFNAEVSVNAGAYWDTAAKKLVWDEKGEAWKKASWEQSMQFAYRTVTDPDDEDEDEPLTVIENCFTDTLSKPPTRFPLMLKDHGDFNCTFETVNDQITMETAVWDSEIFPPTSRKNSPVKSVFPSSFVARFDWGGMSFTGAFKDKDGNVVAVRGDVSDDDESPLLPALAKKEGASLAKDVNYPLNNFVVPISAPAANPPIGLKVKGLMGNDTMIPDEKDPTGWADSVSKLAMQDFHDIIIFYMDQELRDIFVGKNPALDANIKAIALSGGDETAKFYKSLQVPYLTAMLANSTVDEAKSCNGVRAEKLLKEIPADSKVYKAQSAALYRFRYLEKFPGTKKFIQDQNDQDYSAAIDKTTEVMKRLLRKNTSGLEASNAKGADSHKASVAKAEADIDKLGKWAKQENLYWALRLLYMVQKSQLPQWYAMYMNGNLSSSIGMRIKQLNGVFEILENNKINKDGMSFSEAYNDTIRAFQMRSIIPQLVDLDGCYSDFDSVLKESLNQFWLHYKDSKDPNLAEQANQAKQLYTNEELRNKFMTSLKASSRLSSAASSWSVIVQMWEETVRKESWFKAALFVNEKFFTCMKYFAASALLMMPLLPVWSTMSTAEKVMWGISVAGVVAAVTIRIATGAFRYALFFKEISGWYDTLRTIFGFEMVIDKIPQAAEKISSSAGRYFLRTAKQTAILAEEEAALPFGGIRYFSRFSKMFGRSFSELIGTVAGFALAAVCLVLSAISLAKETDPLLIAVDVLMILSSAVQILAIFAGWAIAAGVSTALGTLSLVATWGGPLGVLLAVIGIIIVIVWAFTHKEENPVEKFVNNHVKPAGLYMNFKAIDYMEGLAATATTASRYGVSVCWMNDTEEAYLSLDAPRATSGSVKGTKLLDFTSDTVWALRTDGHGRSQIYTQKAYQDPQAGTLRQVWFLSATDNEKGVCARRLPNKSEDEAKYKEAQKLTRWVVSVMANPVEDADTKAPVSALCSVCYQTRDGSQKLALKMDEKQQLTLTAPSLPFKFDTWLFEIQSLGPLPFHYSRTPWTIRTSHRNEKNRAIFDDPLATSTGYKWTIEPALDDRFLELVTTSGNDEGTIRLKDGAEPKIMSKTSYTVKCTLMVNGTPHGQQQATVEIEVV